MIKNGDIWINKKTGHRYRILEVARHTEEDYDLVIYQSAAYRSIEVLHEFAKKVEAKPYDLFLEEFTKKDD